MCRRKGERERRLRSKRCVCPCVPPRWIVILQRRLSIMLCGTGRHLACGGYPASRLDASGLSQKALNFPSLEFRRRGCPANFREAGSPPAPQARCLCSFSFHPCTRGWRMVTVPRIMRVSVMKCMCLLGTVAAMAICSCEKHSLGEIPEVQREQIDPAKAWSQGSEMNSEKSSSSPTPAEFFPAQTRP